ncbi:MAG: hypothetical protein JST54_10210 [Deltaproteobacteria bacterium]|nr:hypothetical protein [Deltaproteobacteria bacterium]
MRRALPLLALAMLELGCHKPVHAYHAAADHFTASFPGTPKREVSEDGKTTSWTAVDLDQTEYDVSLSKLEATTLSTRITSEVLLEKVAGALEKIGAHQTRAAPVTLAGHFAGQEADYVSAEKHVEYRFKRYVVGHNLFQVLVVGTSDKLHTPRADAFLDSFTVDADAVAEAAPRYCGGEVRAASSSGQVSAGFVENPSVMDPVHIDNAPGPLVGRVLLSDFTECSVTSTPLSAAAQATPANLILAGALKGAIQNPDDEHLVRQKDITVDGFPAIEFEISIEKGRRHTWGRFVFANGWLDQALTVAPPEDVGVRQVQRFLDSMHVGANRPQASAQ